MLKSLLCDELNQFRVVEDLSAISDIVENKNHHLWLDLERPSREEIEMIQEEFNLHPLAIEDAMSRHQRPKVEQYDNFYLVIFYSVGIVEPGQEDHSEVRLGLKGTRFHSVGGDEQGKRDGAQRNGTPSGSLGGSQVRGLDKGKDGADADGQRIVLRELTMFMGENYLITVHTDPVPELDEAAKRWQRNMSIICAVEEAEAHIVPGTRSLNSEERRAIQVQQRPQQMVVPDGDGAKTNRRGEPDSLAGRSNGRGSENDIGILLYSLLDSIVDNYFPVIDSIVDRIEDLEEQVFEHYNQQAIESIFNLKKDLLALRKVLAPERDVLNVLIRRDLPIFEGHTLVYFQDVYDHTVRITDSIDTYRDLLSSALDSFLSTQSNRLNSTVQTLTSFSLILMSIAAITSWYGMNFTMMPELNSLLGYPGVMLVVALVVIAELIYFKRKGWL